MSNEISLETKRLILRPFRESDLDEYSQMFADPVVMRYLGKPLGRMDAWRNMATQIGHWQLRGFGLWAAEEKASGRMIGRIGCFQPEGWPGFEVGWMLRTDFWGRGFAIEGARASMDYAFTVLGRPSVVSVIHPDNAASLRVASKLGERFQRETEVAGVRVAVYGIQREEWIARQLLGEQRTAVEMVEVNDFEPCLACR